MFKKSLLLTLLMALLMPWAAQAQTRERLTFDFEDNAIPSTWTNDATYPWVVVSESTDSGHTGTYCIKSGNTGVHSSSSTLSATFTFWEDGTISFLGGCYGEGTSYVWDKCIFSIDGDQQFANGALQTWETYTYEVTAGEHTFTWSFTKDSSAAGTGDAFFVDDIVVELGEAPACPPPTGVAVSNIGSYGATISWTGTNDSYIVMVGQPNIDANYDFEDITIPADFTNDANYPWTVVANTHSGSYCAKSATGNNSQTSALELEVTLASAKNLTFSAKVSSEASYDKAYFSIDGTVKINGISGAGDWIDYSYTLAAGTHTLRWYYTKDSSVASNDDCFYVDDIVLSSVDSWDETHTASASPYTFTDLDPETEYFVRVKGICDGTPSDPSSAVSFTTLPTCAVPTGLAINGLVATWNAGEATEWNLRYKPVSENEWTTEPNLNAPTYTFSGLLPNTTYMVQVQAGCGSAWSASVTFTTPCDAFDLPYSYGFEDAAEFACWTVSGAINSGTGIASASDAPEGSYLFKFNYHETNAYLVSPIFNGAQNGLDVTFQYMNNSTSTSYTEEFQVGYTTDENADPSAFTYGETIYGQNQWVTYENSFPANTKRIAIKYIYTDGMALRLDDFNFEESANCKRPGNLTASNITGRTADLNWIAKGDERQWQISVNDGEPFLVSESSYTLTGLTPSTDYVVMVRAYCDETDQSVWSQPVSFTTDVACPAPTDLTVNPLTPFSATLNWTGSASQYNVYYRPVAHGEALETQDFETSDLGSWTNIDADGDGYVWMIATTSPGVYHNSGVDLTGNGYNESIDFVTSGSYSNYAGVALTPDNYLVSPQVALGGKITFWAQAQDPNYPAEHFGVAVSVNGNTDAADFVTIATYDMTAKGIGATVNPGTTRSGSRGGGTWYQYSVNLEAYAGQTGYVAIRHFGCTDMFMLNVDDIVIEGPAVEAPWIQATVSGNSLAITGLTPETEYEWQVQSVCGGQDGASLWANALFTTPSNCDTPTNLNSIPLTETATVAWQAYQESFNVRYREVGVDWIQVGTDYTATGDWTQYSFDLSAYAGQTGYVAIRHYNVTDQYWLLVDDVTYGGTTYDFDDGELPTGWTTYDMDGDGYIWTVYDLTFSDTTSYAHSGNYGLTTQSYVNNVGALTPDNWIILPVSTLGGTLSFYAAGLDASYAAEVFGVYVYLGEEYAFENNNLWTVIEGVTNPYEITHLNPVTDYEWEVQGVNASCTGGLTDWSETAYFTTNDYCDVPTGFDLLENTGNSATMSWIGYQDSYNVQYRTAEVYEEYFYDWFETEDLTNWTGDNLASETCYQVTSSGIWGYVFWEEGIGAQTLISTEMEPTTEGTILDFYTASSGNSTYKVGFSSTDNNLESFTWSEELTVAGDGYFHGYEGEVPEGTKYFAVQYVSNDAEGYMIVTAFEVYNMIAEAGEWVEMNGVTSPVTMAPLEPETEYDVWIQGVNCDGEGTNTDWVKLYFTTMPDVLVFVSDGYWSDANNWLNHIVGNESIDILIQANAIIPAGTTIYAGQITIDEGGSITIEDGGQLVHETEGLVVTMENEIEPWTDANTTANYQLIAFPFIEEVAVPAAMTAAEGNDFYMFDNSAVGEEWQNNLQQTIENVIAGEGYLYSNPSDITLSLTGPTNASNNEVSIDLVYNTDNEVNGWYLLGNPYTCNAYVYGSNDSGRFAMEVMYYDENGDMQSINAGPVAPLQGFFVKITEDTQVWFATEEQDLSKASAKTISLDKESNTALVLVKKQPSMSGKVKVMAMPIKTTNKTMMMPFKIVKK